MKLITGKQPAKRVKSKPTATLAAVTAVSNTSVKELALECWRLKKLIARCGDRRQQFMLQTSVDKMIAALAASGIEIEDPEGTEFRDGMILNIAVFDMDDKLAMGERVVSETLSPHVFINNRRAHTARVVVSVGARHDLPGA